MSGEWSIPEHLTWQYYGEPLSDGMEAARNREDEYQRLLEEEAEIERQALYTEPDAEFQLLLSNEHDELKSVIAHNEQVFESISALCTLWRNGVMNGDNTLKFIQNIVG